MRTTILLEDTLMLEVKSLASKKGTTATQIIREALMEYLRKQPPGGLPSFAGVGRSKGTGAGKISETLEEALGTTVDPHEGSGGRRR